MTATALVVLIVSLAVVWGGLAASTVYLRRHPEEDDGASATPTAPIVMHDL
ncbi:methionine/alanine import family NSS transporter small subunit [Pengzhenrongella frigida]|uniref:Methionine/alanine import family NSS transporter small subunit n=1 Tax=Pengzhenrongella frigida TaxID=1259133 RepID=A0A4Q5N1D6_9MICO|nr:methionine/alanine import family NSS transporter small subunit [Cellulomonas sp. HLT2-17]RYV51880.1 methionine/alanine import family NSS transporter small subunit [Cellulomonas sp. HLT2-17]